MNEKIRELAIKAELIVEEWDGYNSRSLTSNQKKFAELIVRECIDTAFHKGHPDLEFLLKHFGVEE